MDIHKDIHMNVMGILIDIHTDILTDIHMGILTDIYADVRVELSELRTVQPGHALCPTSRTLRSA